MEPETITLINKTYNKNIVSDSPVEPAITVSISIEELLDEVFPQQVWLAEGIIPASAFTIISGQPSTYKTWFSLDLALSVAAGKPLFGEFQTQQSGVMIVDEESGRPLLQRQLSKLGAAKGLPIRIRSFHNFKLDANNIALLLLECKAYGLETVIFDSLSQIHDGNENEASDMAPILKHLQKLTANGISVIVIAHNRKTSQFTSYGGGEIRGSSAIFAAADAHLTLIPIATDRIVVRQNKLRYAALPKPFELLVTGDDETFAFEYLGLAKEKSSRENVLKAAVLKQLGLRGSLISKDLIHFLKESGVKANDKNLPPVLLAMLEEKLIVKSPGDKHSTIYGLASSVSLNP